MGCASSKAGLAHGSSANEEARQQRPDRSRPSGGAAAQPQAAPSRTQTGEGEQDEGGGDAAFLASTATVSSSSSSSSSSESHSGSAWERCSVGKSAHSMGSTAQRPRILEVLGSGPLGGTGARLRQDSLLGVTSRRQLAHVKDTQRLRLCKVGGCTFVNKYLVIKYLGRGSCGRVFLCMDINDRQLYAVKIVKKGELEAGKAAASGRRRNPLEDLQREIAIMRRMLHPNVVALREVVDDSTSNKMLLVMDYMEGGPVMTREGLERGHRIPESVARLYFRDMAQGLAYLHANNVVHGDLKPENALMSGLGQVALSDFGCSKVLAHEEEELDRCNGTPAFLAPEMMRPNARFRGFPADVYALGACLYTFVFGRIPFSAPTVMKLFEVVQSTPVTFPDSIPATEPLKDLLLGMLTKDPKQRLPLSSVLQHPWVTLGGKAPLVPDTQRQHTQRPQQQQQEEVQGQEQQEQYGEQGRPVALAEAMSAVAVAASMGAPASDITTHGSEPSKGRTERAAAAAVAGVDASMHIIAHAEPTSTAVAVLAAAAADASVSGGGMPSEAAGPRDTDWPATGGGSLDEQRSEGAEEQGDELRREDQLRGLVTPELEVDSFAPGQLLLRHGERGSHMLYILEGECEVWYTPSHQQPVTTPTSTPGTTPLPTPSSTPGGTPAQAAPQGLSNAAEACPDSTGSAAPQQQQQPRSSGGVLQPSAMGTPLGRAPAAAGGSGKPPLAPSHRRSLTFADPAGAQGLAPSPNGASTPQQQQPPLEPQSPRRRNSSPGDGSSSSQEPTAAAAPLAPYTQQPPLATETSFAVGPAAPGRALEACFSSVNSMVTSVSALQLGDTGTSSVQVASFDASPTAPSSEAGCDASPAAHRSEAGMESSLAAPGEGGGGQLPGAAASAPAAAEVVEAAPVAIAGPESEAGDAASPHAQLASPFGATAGGGEGFSFAAPGGGSVAAAPALEAEAVTPSFALTGQAQHAFNPARPGSASQAATSPPALTAASSSRQEAFREALHGLSLPDGLAAAGSSACPSPSGSAAQQQPCASPAASSAWTPPAGASTPVGAAAPAGPAGLLSPGPHVRPMSADIDHAYSRVATPEKAEEAEVVGEELPPTLIEAAVRAQRLAEELRRGDGNEFLVGVRGPGQVLGEMELLGGGSARRCASVVAASAVRAAVVPYAAAKDYLSRTPLAKQQLAELMWVRQSENIVLEAVVRLAAVGTELERLLQRGSQGPP